MVHIFGDLSLIYTNEGTPHATNYQIIFKALTIMRDRLNISGNNLVITKVFVIGSNI